MSGQDLNLELIIKARGDQARSEIAATNASIKGMQAEAAAATATAAEQQTAAVARTATAMEAGSAATDAAAASMRQLNRDIESAARVSPIALNEFRALFDEISSGRTYRSPGTIAIIAQKVFGLSTAALLAGGAVVGLVAGVGYLAVKAIEAANAIDRISIGAAFAGNLNLTSQEIKKVADEVGSGGEEIAAVLGRVGAMSNDVFEGLTISAAQYAQAMGIKAPQAAKIMADALDNQHLSVARLQQIFPGITAAEAENYLTVQRLGDVHKTAAALIDLVNQRMQLGRDRVIKYGAGWTSAGNDIRLGAAEIDNYLPTFGLLSGSIEGGIKLWDQYGTAIEGALAELHKYTSFLDGSDPVKNVHSDLAKEAAAKFDAQHRAAAAAAARAGAGTPNYKGAADKLSSGLASQIDSLNADIATLNKALADPTATDKQKENWRLMVADDQRQLDALQHKKTDRPLSFMDGAREQLAKLEEDEQVSDDKRLSFELTFWQKKLAVLSAGSREYAQVLRTAQGLQRQIDSQRTAQARQDLEAQIQATITAARDQVNQKRSILQQEVQLGQISTQQEIAQEKDLQTQLYAIELKALQDRLKLEDLRPAARKRINDQIEALEKQHQLKMEQLTNQAAIAEQQSWEKALQPISQAFDQTVRGMIQGTQTLQRGLANILDSIAMEFVDMEVKTLVHHIATEAAKTASTTAAATARAAIETTAKTQSLAMSAELGLKQILNDAWQAASAAFKATAAIPVVGPILAPAAGAAAFAAVAAMGGNIASAAGGYWELPSDQMIFAHEREMVLPAKFAEGLRGMIEGGSRAAPGPSHTTIHAVDAESFTRLLKRNPGALGDGLASFRRNRLLK